MGTYVGEGVKFPTLDQANLPSLYPEVEDSLATDSKTKTRRLETNRYFFTERFRPLMTDLLDHVDFEDDVRAVTDTGFTGGHHNKEHHAKQNSVLPGVFFIYEIYPFAMEISQNEVPFTHLLIRLMATIGSVFTLARWLDSILDNRSRGGSGRSPTKFSVNTR